MQKKRKDKQKILFLITELTGGGAEKSLIELLRNFDYTQFEVSLCVICPGGAYWNEIPKEVHVHVLFSMKGSIYRKAFRYYRKYQNTWLFSILLRSKLEKYYDVIVSFLEGQPLFLHTMILSRGGKNITWIHCDLYEFHYTVPSAFLDNAKEKKAYEEMDEIIFVSQNAMNSFESLYQIETPKRYIYNLIDNEKIIRLGGIPQAKKDKIIISTVGRLTEVKGYDKLIRVAKKFKDTGYSLLFQIVGDGEDREKLKTMSEDLGLQEYVSFLGFQSNPYPYIANSDIFVSSSLSEGMSRVICEAFVLAIPVVATKTAGALELLDNGNFGILVDFEEEAIFEGLKKMVDNKEVREFYSQRSLERAHLFDTEQVMQSIYNLL